MACCRLPAISSTTAARTPTTYYAQWYAVGRSVHLAGLAAFRTNLCRNGAAAAAFIAARLRRSRGFKHLLSLMSETVCGSAHCRSPLEWRWFATDCDIDHIIRRTIVYAVVRQA